MRSCFAAVGFLVSSFAPAHAQARPSAPPWPEVGARVLAILPSTPDDDRVFAFRVPPRLIGQVVATSPDTLYVQPHPQLGVIAVPRPAIRSLFVSRGRSRWRSAVNYGFTFALLGAFHGDVTYDHTRDGTRGESIATDAALGAVGGIAVGLLWPREFWRRVRHGS